MCGFESRLQNSCTNTRVRIPASPHFPVLAKATIKSPNLLGCRSEKTMEQANETPREDLMKAALEHYEEASTAIMHWNSDIPKAIRYYYKTKEKNMWTKFKAWLRKPLKVTYGKLILLGVIAGASHFLLQKQDVIVNTTNEIILKAFPAEEVVIDSISIDTAK